MLGIFLLIEWSIRHDARCKVSLRIVVLLVVVNFLQGFFTNYWNPPFHRTIFQMFLFQPLFNHPSWSQLSALVPHFCTAFTKAVPASHWNSKKLFYKPGSFFEDSVQIQLVRVSFILNNGVTDTNLLRRPPEQGVLRPVYSSNHAFIFKNYSLSACSMFAFFIYVVQFFNRTDSSIIQQQSSIPLTGWFRIFSALCWISRISCSGHRKQSGGGNEKSFKFGTNGIGLNATRSCIIFIREYYVHDPTNRGRDCSVYQHAAPLQRTV